LFLPSFPLKSSMTCTNMSHLTSLSSSIKVVNLFANKKIASTNKLEK
jgi:hypothetical protein